MFTWICQHLVCQFLGHIPSDAKRKHGNPSILSNLKLLSHPTGIDNLTIMELIPEKKYSDSRKTDHTVSILIPQLAQRFTV